MKECPRCGNTNLINYSSLQYRQCSNCGEKIPWNLEENQKPIVSNNRATRNNQEE